MPRRDYDKIAAHYNPLATTLPSQTQIGFLDGASNHSSSNGNNHEANNDIAADPPNFHRISKRRYNSANNVDGNDTILSYDHPDDESATFFARGSKSRYARWYITSRLSYLRNGWRKFREKFDNTRLGLVALMALAFAFLGYGTGGGFSGGGVYNMDASSNRGSYSVLKGSMIPPSRAGNTATTNNARGYQARSQVPIPVEYARFVELSEFAEAATIVRAHRMKAAMEGQQQGEGEQLEQEQHGRRLDENDENESNDNKGTKEGEVVNNKGGDGTTENNNDNNEEVDEMNDAMDKLWQDTMKSNPELERQKQKEKEQQENLLKVNHVPFFWHIPRSGGTTLSTLLSTCHYLVQATSSFSSPPVFRRGQDELFSSRFRDPKLYVVRTRGELFVNVDLDSLEGVQRAVKGGLIEKELADVVLVPDARLGSLLFDKRGQSHTTTVENKDGGDNGGMNGENQQKKEYEGVLFAMFRHPIDRSASWFYHKQSVKDSVHYDPSLEIYSLTDWINSPSYITDYMVRTLVGKVGTAVPLTPDDLDVAKEILRRKCVIGLLEEKGESMKRFEKFFGWNADVHRDSLFLLEDEDTAHAMQAERWKNVKDEECRDRLLHWNWLNKNKHTAVEEGSLAYNLLESKNRYDIELYLYARQLFDEQYIQLGFDDDEGI